MQDILLTQIRLALLFALWILAIIRTGKTTVQDGGDVSCVHVLLDIGCIFIMINIERQVHVS